MVVTPIVVDVKHQVPLLGRDWIVAFGLDLPTIPNQILQVFTTVIESLVNKFTDFFKEKLGVL